MAENIITQKVGPLPLVVWVAGGAGVIGIFILMSHKGNNGAAANQTNQVQSLAPTEAEAFGTIEQQQQDVTNALTTLGNNQSALGGSLSTLTGIVTQQGADNAAAFQNLVNGQQTIEQGQTAAADQSKSYYDSLAALGNANYAQLGNVYSGLGGLLGYMSARQGTYLGWLGGGSSQQFAAAEAAQIPYGPAGQWPNGYWDAVDKALGIINPDYPGYPGSGYPHGAANPYNRVTT